MATAELPRDDLIKLIRAMQRDIDLLKMQSPLANTGLSVTGSGELVVTGGIESSTYDPGVTGWRFDGTSLEINTGAIGNSALVTPVLPGIANATGTGFALSQAGWTTVASIAAVIPQGCTKVLAFVSGFMFVTNPNQTGGANAGADALYTYVSFGSGVSNTYATGISGFGGFATSSASSAFLLTGLTPGATVTVAVYGSTGYQDIAADPTNHANVSAQLVWLKS